MDLCHHTDLMGLGLHRAGQQNSLILVFWCLFTKLLNSKVCEFVLPWHYATCNQIYLFTSVQPCVCCRFSSSLLMLMTVVHLLF